MQWLQARGVQVFNYLDCAHERRVRDVSREGGARWPQCRLPGVVERPAASLEHSMEMGVVLERRAAAGVAEVIDAVLAAATKWL